MIVCLPLFSLCDFFLSFDTFCDFPKDQSNSQRVVSLEQHHLAVP